METGLMMGDETKKEIDSNNRETKGNARVSVEPLKSVILLGIKRISDFGLWFLDSLLHTFTQRSLSAFRTSGPSSLQSFSHCRFLRINSWVRVSHTNNFSFFQKRRKGTKNHTNQFVSLQMRAPSKEGDRHTPLSPFHCVRKEKGRQSSSLCSPTQTDFPLLSFHTLKGTHFQISPLDDHTSPGKELRVYQEVESKVSSRKGKNTDNNEAFTSCRGNGRNVTPPSRGVEGKEINTESML